MKGFGIPTKNTFWFCFNPSRSELYGRAAVTTAGSDGEVIRVLHEQFNRVRSLKRNRVKLVVSDVLWQRLNMGSAIFVCRKFSQVRVILSSDVKQIYLYTLNCDAVQQCTVWNFCFLFSFQFNIIGRVDKSIYLYNQLRLILILEGTITMWHQAYAAVPPLLRLNNDVNKQF